MLSKKWVLFISIFFFLGLSPQFKDTQAIYACNESCALNPAGCNSPLVCSGGLCRNSSCTSEASCICPTAPTGLNRQCNVPGYGQATFSWNSVSGASAYILRIDKNPDVWMSAGDQWICVNGTSWAPSITGGESYEGWSVQSSDTGCAARWGATDWADPFTCPLPTPTPTATPTPRPWIKLKDSSYSSKNSLSNDIPLLPISYDADDTTQPFFIIGGAGVVTAPSINITVFNPAAKTGNPEYKALYTPTYSMTPALFLSYVKARKEYTVITDVSQIDKSGIYVYNGNLSIDSSSNPFNQIFNIVLISTSTSTVTIDRVAPSTTFTPGGSVAIIAPTINFNDNLTEATGIFIGNTISTGTNATQGLKIVGNLIAQTSLTNSRKWADVNKPAIFLVFDQGKYLDLLPYLSMAIYDWRQTQ